MFIQFATCERKRALGFLRVLYPSRAIEDEGLTKAVLDFVEADVIRIPDPMMHGMSVGIHPSKNWSEALRDEVIRALQAFHDEASHD